MGAGGGQNPGKGFPVLFTGLADLRILFLSSHILCAAFSSSGGCCWDSSRAGMLLLCPVNPWGLEYQDHLCPYRAWASL